MTFSESMQACLRGSGVRVEVEPQAPRATRGATCPATIRVSGGTDEALLRSVVLRLLVATRQWTEPDGQPVEASRFTTRASRRHLSPVWTRTTVAEARVEVHERVAAGASTVVDAEVPVPEACPVTGPGTVLSVNAQAVVEGQIDPTASAAVTIE
ncbi:MAG: hypothetical protein B7733_08160 [Myxococcales bacterium FL481]|nr:MAG: hypothetical protein B7733_08160 [Myxococcales bacterium FL481]